MAELHDLSPPAGSRRDPKRLGRGPGSGTGKTAGRGQKGAGARAGSTTRPGFEGGQMPLQRRIPKRGFKNFRRVEHQVVNVRDLAGLTGKITPESLKDAGLIGTLRRPVKVLGEGDLDTAVSVSAHAFSKSARAKIEGAGGSVAVLIAGANDPGTEVAAADAGAETRG